MQKKQKRKDKNIKLYFVQDRNYLYFNNDLTQPNILCVTATEKEAKEYINRKLLQDNYSHYFNWCSLRNISIDDSSWTFYLKMNTVINPYIYSKVKVSHSSIANLFRMFYGCNPIGCSFDTVIEVYTKEIQNKIEDKKVEENKGEA